jgi:hypothetical protein
MRDMTYQKQETAPAARHSFFIPAWENFRNAVINGCGYWDIGFGDHRFDGEALIRECYVEGRSVDQTVEAWDEIMLEEIYEHAL